MASLWELTWCLLTQEVMQHRASHQGAVLRKVGHVGKPLGSHMVCSRSRTGANLGASGQQSCVYANNPTNRRLGRVGEPWETDIEHIYSDSVHNRRLGRVGKKKIDKESKRN